MTPQRGAAKTTVPPGADDDETEDDTPPVAPPPPPPTLKSPDAPQPLIQLVAWGKYRNHRCGKCTFAALRESQIREHLVKRHKVPGDLVEQAIAEVREQENPSG